jgi:hypothetical protein
VSALDLAEDCIYGGFALAMETWHRDSFGLNHGRTGLQTDDELAFHGGTKKANATAGLNIDHSVVS